jgi:hypothetical protein
MRSEAAGARVGRESGAAIVELREGDLAAFPQPCFLEEASELRRGGFRRSV